MDGYSKLGLPRINYGINLLNELEAKSNRHLYKRKKMYTFFSLFTISTCVHKFTHVDFIYYILCRILHTFLIFRFHILHLIYRIYTFNLSLFFRASTIMLIMTIKTNSWLERPNRPDKHEEFAIDRYA